MPFTASIYCRISKDRESEKLGVERQEADCRALGERLGFEVVEVFVDNDISASTKSSKPRPAYLAMLDAARSGEVGAILAYSNSRLTRRPREFEDLIDLHDRHGVQLHTVVSGSFDLATADGRRMARFLAGESTAEAERTSERVKRAKAQMSEDGKYRGGQRPFGYDSDGVTVREAEAAVVREATTAVLAGRTLAGIVRDFNERGLRTSKAREWTAGGLRAVLTRPRNAGLLAHGRADRGLHEIIRPGVWPAIVDEETWRAVCVVLLDPERRSSSTGNEPKWLGANLYLCGRCGSPMRVSPFGRPEARRNYYRCTGSPHLAIRAEDTDEYIRQVVIERIRDPRVAAQLEQHDSDGALTVDRERRGVLVARLVGFERDYTNGDITGAQLRRATDKVTAELNEIDIRLTSGLRGSTASPILSANDPGVAFLEAPLDVQRAVLSVLMRVEIAPAAGRGLAWSPTRLKLSEVAA